MTTQQTDFTALRAAHYEASGDYCFRCGAPWPCPTIQALDALEEATTQAEELNHLFDLQHQRGIEAIKRWREEDPKGRELTIPDYGRLLDWLWQELQESQVALGVLGSLLPQFIELAENYDQAMVAEWGTGISAEEEELVERTKLLLTNTALQSAVAQVQADRADAEKWRQDCQSWASWREDAGREALAADQGGAE